MGFKIGLLILLYTTIICFQLCLCMSWDEYSKKSTECDQKCGGDKHFYGEMRKGMLYCFRNPRNDIERLSICLLQCLDVVAEGHQSDCWCEACKHKFDPELNFCEKPFDNPMTEDDCKTRMCTGNPGNVRYFGEWCTGDSKEKIERAKALEKEHKLE